MKTKTIVLSSLVLIGVLLIALLGRVKPSEAAETRQLLQTSLNSLEVPGPGQIAHYTYTVYQRTPPLGLEPEDPYHLSYSTIWPPVESEDTWVEINTEGQSIRWRTQLRSENGSLLQDLMFDGSQETDYFVLESRASKHPEPVNSFRDNRAALIQEFLMNDQLMRREGPGWEGRTVLMIYTQPQALEGAPEVEEALLNFTRPFLADLQAVSTGTRIDFDASSLVPLGTAWVVWDETGAEHVATYRQFSSVEIVPSNSQAAQAVFDQNIPEEAFRDNPVVPLESMQFVNDLAQVAELGRFPVFALNDLSSSFRVLSTRFVINESNERIWLPRFAQGPFFAATTGAGVETIYADRHGDAQLIVIQGRIDDMRQVFAQTMPTWLEARQESLAFGDQIVMAWRLVDLDAARVRYILELPETLVYLESSGLSLENVTQLLETFQRVE